MPTSTDPHDPLASGRVRSIDALRGIAMVLMALDHARDFFGIPGVDPTNLASASASLFMTRWVTHICAPVFFLLTGVGSSLSRTHARTGHLARFLLLRGALLVLLELTVIRTFAYQFNVDYRVTLLSVIWALGWSMIALGVLVALPRSVLAAFGLILVFGHNLLDDVTWTNPIWLVAHRPGVILQGAERIVFVAYPLVPWVGVTALGFALGEVYRWNATRRRKLLLVLGVLSIAAFVGLRATGLYGNPGLWQTQPTQIKTFLAFLNVNKYPPSLQFLLMTLGPAMLMLRWLDRGIPRLLALLVEYGRAPFFYYVVHFFAIHALAMLVCLIRYGDAHWMFESPSLSAYPFSAPPGWGFPLPVVYLIWLSIVVSLYPVCRWVARAKARSDAASWLSYT
jgi:uncharacterized membrane protein